MIHSYESLLHKWIVNGQAEKIIFLKHNKRSQMDFFLKRDCVELVESAPASDHRTLLSLLRCFSKETIDTLTEELEDLQATSSSDSEEDANDAIEIEAKLDIVRDLAKPDELAKKCLTPFVQKLQKQDSIMII